MCSVCAKSLNFSAVRVPCLLLYSMSESRTPRQTHTAVPLLTVVVALKTLQEE